MKRLTCLLLSVWLFHASGIAFADPGNQSGRGLSPQATAELVAAGVDRYLGAFTPTASTDVGGGWTKHAFAQNFFGDGPLCIAGTPYSVFTKERNPENLLIFMQGGGACWQNFYFCNILSEAQEPQGFPQVGIFADSFSPESLLQENPLGDYSIVYMPYCDGSVFTGDNDVFDPGFPFGPVRFHRGLENASAGIDVARTIFPGARRILLAGSSAGGVGVAGFTPFLVRMAYGNRPQLSVFNDAGPVAANLNDVAGVSARAADWNFDQYYPASCTDCSALGQQTAIIKWRLDNDNSIRESFYSTDGDATDRFFLGVPTQEAYRELILTEHGALNEAHPDRYKRFIRSGDNSHTALQNPLLYYLGTANGVPLFEWVADFLKPGTRDYREHDNESNGPKKNAWVDIVEEFEPLP